MLDKIRSLFKGRSSEKRDKRVEKPTMQNVAEFALSDLKSGLLDGSYALVIWDKECGDPGAKPDLRNVVAVIDGGSLAYASITEDGKVLTLQLTSSNIQGFLTVYIVTRSFFDELLKRFENSVKRLGIDPEEVAVIFVASPETLKKFFNIESSACLITPIPRSSAENTINEVVNEIEKRLKSAVEASKQMELAQTASGNK